VFKRKRLPLIFTAILIISLTTTCSDVYAKNSLPNTDTKVAILKQPYKSENALSLHINDTMSPFEISAAQKALAPNNSARYSVLDASRGNPNWINTQARYAFIRLMDFALEECKRDFYYIDIAGQAQLNGIADRFDKAMNPNEPIDVFLIKSVDYCVNRLGLNKDALIKELVDGIIGDYYPTRGRCLKHCEVVINNYLQSILHYNADLKNETLVFPTEGGTAAICYIFNSLAHNKLLNPGDKIAIATPTFSPYLEIPNVNNYNLVSVNINASEDNMWDIDEKEISKLANKEIKAFFVVNPSNPAAHSLSPKTLASIKNALKKNPDLIIITDDVYATFAKDFQTIYSVAPFNTILVYSYSKLYGVTGWRIGLIAMNKNNVCDSLLAKLPVKHKKFLAKEYSSIVTDSAELPFIERIVADSRSIGLYHTSGLNTPSQVFMTLLSLTHLTSDSEDSYIKTANLLVERRYKTLMRSLSINADADTANTRYYTLININRLFEKSKGKEFAEWKTKNVSDLDFLTGLAAKKGVILLYGPGFSAPKGSVRVSLANLKTNDYATLGKRLKEYIHEYYLQYLKSKNSKK